MQQAGASSIIVRVGGSLLLLACASSPQPAIPAEPESPPVTAPAAGSGEPSASLGKSQSPRRLDGTPPPIRIVVPVPRSADRSQSFLDITVDIDVDGRPDMKTLRVTGWGADDNRIHIRRWIADGTYAPATDAGGQPVRGRFKVHVSMGG